MSSALRPSFTVIIPTYNRAEFIRDTLESVLAQSYTRYEIIVVDNCSTDGTPDVLDPYIKDARIRFFRNDQNRERAYSRNVGLENATGDYVTFLDSDDLMYPENLSDAANFAMRHPDLKCFHNRYELLDRGGKVIYRYRLPSLAHPRRAISNGNFMCCIGNFLHRDIYSRYRFDTTEDLTGSEDWEFWIQVLGENKIGRIEKVNSGIVQHAERSINTQDVTAMERGLKYMVTKMRSSENLSRAYAEYLDRIESNSFLYLNLLSNDARDWQRGWKYLVHATKIDPSVVLTGRFLRSLRRTLMVTTRARRKVFSG
jgi:glycosyltransferase involved in cell wall biosynthesis